MGETVGDQARRRTRAEVFSDLFAHADLDRDDILNEEEAAHFREILRQYVADTVLSLGGSDDDEAMTNLLRLLEEHPEGGIERRHLLEAAPREHHPELAAVVEQVFVAADRDGDGVLNAVEARDFARLLEAEMLGDDDMGLGAEAGIGEERHSLSHAAHLLSGHVPPAACGLRTSR